jgi:HlyD family secretion protein
MDRALIPPRRWRLRAAIAVAAVGAVTGAALWLRAGGRTLHVAHDRVVIAEVTRAPFEDFIPLTGTAAPPRSAALDAPEGGRVERIVVEPGTAVRAGDLLVQLSNPSLQLEVISREAQVTEQLSNLRNTELSLEQARLQQERELIEVESQLERFETASKRLHALYTAGAVPTEEVEEADRQLRYFTRRHEFLARERAIGDRLRRRQFDQLKSSTEMLQKHLEFARGHLHDLEIRAPFDGTLTALELQLGQSLARGQHTGQLDLPGPFKLVARVDQFYAGRVAVGQRARTADDRALAVTKLYPLVERGQFAIDLEFAEAPPASLRRGQGVQLRLFIGEPTDAVLIPNGELLEHTGGRWVFVVSPDGARATRRAVELGRRNPRFVEVLRGLAAGERVVTSSYASYADVDELAID